MTAFPLLVAATAWESGSWRCPCGRCNQQIAPRVRCWLVGMVTLMRGRGAESVEKMERVLWV